MNIATINDTLLPVVLFIIYFVIASVICYNLKAKTTPKATNKPAKNSEKFPKTFTYKDAFSPQFDPEPKEEVMASVQPENVEEIVVSIADEITENQSSDLKINTSAIGIERSLPELIDRLGKRDLRKLCSPLGIKQKTNGTELTTELMKALVKRKFKENPQKVIQVISDRLPHLLPAFSELNQQHSLEKEAC
ncbi:MAG: hypothetical protein HC820_00920 [Hydrococcus sp. RM1_1_31]|nr:hypothetical protein [Hydrococcus sp. RM1_1_31]